jgi:cold shock CspA family protein
MSDTHEFPATRQFEGAVSAFDQRRGVGSVSDPDGATWPFHATAISDGSRDIEVGTVVRFRLAPGHGGRYEARTVTPLVG